MLSSSRYMLIQHFSCRVLPAVARQQRVLIASSPRAFAAVASSAKPVNTTVDQQQHEFIKAAISKLLEQSEPKESAKMVSDEALKKAATYFQVRVLCLFCGQKLFDSCHLQPFLPLTSSHTLFSLDDQISLCANKIRIN